MSKDFIEFCDGCKHLEMNEKEQDEYKMIYGFRPNHKCSKYKCQVLHLGVHPKILRAGICLDNEGFEYHKD